MGDASTPPILISLAAKLRDARMAMDLSTREVACRVGRDLVSHATIANYEKARSMPPLNILAVLAGIYQRPVNWFLESSVTLAGVKYRSLSSKVRVSDRTQYEASAKKWLEAYIRLERYIDQPLSARKSLPKLSPDLDPATAAKELRKSLSIKSDEPVLSVIDAMTQFGIRVIELPTDAAIDGLAALFGGEHVVCLNSWVHNDRNRMNAAHEAVHVASGDCETSERDHQAVEKFAFDVASHFLLPQTRLAEAFKGRSLVNMVKYKETFGISLAAMVYRAEKSRIIDHLTARHLWIEFARRGWKKHEPGTVRPDRATRFESLLDSAIQENRISWREAESVTSIPELELKSRLRIAMGLVDSDPEEGGGGPEILKLGL